MASLSQWSPYGNNVQGGLVDGRFMSGAHTVLCAGPPRLANVGGPEFLGAALTASSTAEDMLAYPIGIVQNFSLSNNTQINRIFELGSDRAYQIPGRTVGQLGLGRVMYHGASLLRVLYAWYQDLIPPTFVNPMFPNIGAATVANPHDVIIPPGYENIFLNLASDLFTQPTGLLQLMKDSNEDTLGAVYYEACYVPNHSLSTDAMGTLIQEQCSIQFERMVPVNTQVVGLITG